METSLLTTKVVIPPARPQLVTRPRLIERLQEGLNYNLILVSAPAGFGKTTLLSEWAHQNQRQSTAWISLDKGDNDPTRFWGYFIAALKTIHPSCGESIFPLLHSSQPLSPQTPIDSLLTILINDIAEIPGDFVVVMDDYHLIESRQIHDGMTYLLEHMPAQMHLVIASRADPPLLLASYRGKGMMLDIGADNLRFTVDDTASLLTEMRAPELSSDQVAALNERTEGWAVGLKMAALSISEQEDIPGFIADLTGNQRYVMDYLMEEVLQKQTEEICDFLLQTSILERLSGTLCDAIIGRKGSRDILRELERGHLFIVPLDKARKWYRYEHLFTDILRHQLEETYTTEDIAGLHRRAGRWYEDNGLSDDAINHALAAQDWEKAARLLNEHGRKKQGMGEFVTILNWMCQLPEEIIIADPELCQLYLSGLGMANKLEAAEDIINKREKMVQDDDTIKGEITYYRAIIAFRRWDMDLAFELAEKALSLLPPDKFDERSSMRSFLGQKYFYQGKYKEAEPLFKEAYEDALKTGKYWVISGGWGGLIMLIQIQGRLHRVAEMCRHQIESFGPSPAVVIPHIMLAWTHYEWNDLEATVYHLQHLLELGRSIGAMQARVGLQDLLALARLAQGDEAGFLEAVEKADFEARNIGDRPALQAEHASRHVLFALRQNDLTTAEKWGATIFEKPEYLTVYLVHVPSRLLIAQGRKSEAAEKLRVMYDNAAQSGAQFLVIIYRVHQALAADSEEDALEFLSDALTMAEPEGWIRTFVDEGKLLKSLLEKALSNGITPKYTRKLITIIEAEERQKRRMKKGEGTSSQSILSEREIEVLKLMAEGLSNQQIADRLIISLGTVKNHVHNIIEKLEAKGRTQAVTQARELDLI